jgi:Glycosyl transferase family 11
VIGTTFHRGQGLGNQLWVYAVVRVIATRKGFGYGFVSPENFKGTAFLSLDMGGHPNEIGPVIESDFQSEYAERVVRHPISSADISPWDPELHDVSDGTLLSGTMQSEKYLEGFRGEISEWFKTSGEYFDGCVISLRGGEYRNIKEVFLPKSYYVQAIEKVRELEPGVKFVVVTDDAALAREYFPDFPVVSSGGVKRIWKWYIHPKSDRIGNDFSRIQHARYLILSNSSFSWWGAFTNQVAQLVIAPKYWARFNVSDGYWSNGDSLTSGWLWLDRFGKYFSHEECSAELAAYRQKTGF